MAVKIGFIGAGRMAGAMIKGLIAKNVYGPEEIVACAPTKETRDRMTQETGIRMFDKASDIAGLTDVLVLAIKPKNIAPLFLEEGVELTGDHLLISIAAGVKIKTLKSYVPDSRIVRVMPNHCCMVLEGAYDVGARVVGVVFGHEARRDVDANHPAFRLVDVFHQRGETAA